MSGKTEKALRRALTTVEALNARGITSRERIALEIGSKETAREDWLKTQRAQKREAKP